MRTTKLKGFVSIFGLTGLAVLAPAPVLAQSAAPATTANPSPDNAAASGEIVVTAQRRSEKQVDVPITVTALNAQALTTGNVQALSDISKLTPALRFDNAGGFYQPTIRGVGTPVTTSGGGTNVGIYIDGFYSPNPLANDFEFLNVQNVQVLKGPQGTLFGHNTTGGAITVQTADPSTTTEVIGKVSYERFNTVRAQAYATTGLTKDIAVDVEGLYTRSDGYLTNVVDGNDKIDQSEDYTIRTGVKAQVTSDVSVMLRYTHSHVNDPTPILTASYYDPVFGSGAPAYALAEPGRYTYNPRQTAVGTGPEEGYFQHTTSDIVQGTIKADLGFSNLTSYTQYRKENVDAAISQDYTAGLLYGNPYFDLGLPNKNKTFSQELLLTSKPGSRLQYTAGVFYFSNRDTYITYINAIAFQLAGATVPGDQIPPVRLGGSSTTTSNLSGFVDATYQLTDQLFLTAGARFSHDRVYDAYFNSPFLPPYDPNHKFFVPNISSNHVTPRAVIRYKPDDHSSVYASFTEGYKAAIIDVGGSCQDFVSNFGIPAFTCNPIKPEKIDAYEVGYKYGDHRFTVDLSAYYYNYRNLQVSAFLAGGTAFILNAASSHIYGFDGQFTAKLDDHFDIQAAGAYTHARFVTFNNAPELNIGGGNGFAQNFTLTNSPMARAPDFTGNVMLHYADDLAGGRLSVSSGLNYTSKVYLGPAGNQLPQSAYATLDARAQWTDPSKVYTLAVYGTNLTNKAYKTEVQAGGAGVGANWAKPVSYGVEVGVKF